MNEVRARPRQLLLLPGACGEFRLCAPGPSEHSGQGPGPQALTGFWVLGPREPGGIRAAQKRSLRTVRAGGEGQPGACRTLRWCAYTLSWDGRPRRVRGKCQAGGWGQEERPCESQVRGGRAGLGLGELSRVYFFLGAQAVSATLGRVLQSPGEHGHTVGTRTGPGVCVTWPPGPRGAASGDGVKTARCLLRPLGLLRTTVWLRGVACFLLGSS